MTAIALAVSLLPALVQNAQSATRNVGTGKELLSALNRAGPGDVINIRPGVLRISGHSRFRTKHAGKPGQPITIRGAGISESTVVVAKAVGLEINKPHWVVENVSFVSVCAPEKHQNCDHAFHIYGDADNLVIRNTRMVDFNAAIKSNGSGPDDDRRFPDNVVIEGSYLYNTAPRRASVPVTAIDVVGGKDWALRDNFIADYAKLLSDGISYHAFLKGHSSRGVIERNLVMCEWRHTEGVRIGLSFGGGGTGAKFCDLGSCKNEHVDGVMRNNIIANCPDDIGVYLNKARNTRLYNNLLYRTGGIDIRFPQSQAVLTNNVIAGSIRTRDGGGMTESANLIAGSWIGMILGPGSRYAKKRLEGQDAKYPSYISKQDVAWAQGLVDTFADSFIDTWLGYGNNTIADLYQAPDSLDFAVVDPEPLAGRGVPVEGLSTDFCGQPRRGSRPDIGPFQVGSPACDPGQRLQRLLAIEQASPINSSTDAASAQE